MVILNKNETEEILSTERFSEIIKKSKTGWDIISGKEIQDISSIKVAPKSALILELN
jgi:hypothetical protein